MKFTFKVDGIEYQVEDGHLAQAVKKLDTKLTEEIEKTKTLNAKNDELQGKLDATTEELKKEKENKPSKDEMVKIAKAKMDLDEFAKKVLGEDAKIDGLSDTDIKKAVLKKINENIKLDDASDDYVNGAFNIAKDNFVQKKTDGASHLENTLKQIPTNDGGDIPDCDKLRAENMKKDSEAWKDGLSAYKN